jgi:hypothetical protein
MSNSDRAPSGPVFFYLLLSSFCVIPASAGMTQNGNRRSSNNVIKSQQGLLTSQFAANHLWYDFDLPPLDHSHVQVPTLRGAQLPRCAAPCSRIRPHASCRPQSALFHRSGQQL